MLCAEKALHEAHKHQNLLDITESGEHQRIDIRMPHMRHPMQYKGKGDENRTREIPHRIVIEPCIPVAIVEHVCHLHKQRRPQRHRSPVDAVQRQRPHKPEMPHTREQKQQHHAVDASHKPMHQPPIAEHSEISRHKILQIHARKYHDVQKRKENCHVALRSHPQLDV